MTIIYTNLEEKVVPGRRLGRHVAHDSASWKYPAPMSDMIKAVVHKTAADLPLDQGDVGSCTGNGMVGMLMSEPFFVNSLKVTGNRLLDENDALKFYSAATHIDHYRGVYPPDDTGSNGLAVCKAAIKGGFFKGYGWSFGLEHALRTLTLQPIIIGTEWRANMDSPDRNGLVRATGAVRGGHEYLVNEIVLPHPYFGDGQDIKKLLADPANLIGCENSWGANWGKGGRFYMSFPDFQSLLQAQGDVKTGIL